MSDTELLIQINKKKIILISFSYSQTKESVCITDDRVIRIHIIFTGQTIYYFFIESNLDEINEIKTHKRHSIAK